ncbi:hypothetical protein [Paraliomyxa miuraensis]|uniref:hypothetical protein n=1 Tax=Paraliomyxa miuraensis TaxID=376150 RepID=UPI00225C21CB|nr:hypothetical protein [Paraliomyxa miuraensis]MCX4242742.1 hypothetical protein [Paraliomyxa miuraensis]
MELGRDALLPRYQRIVDTCEPYLVTYPGNHGALDLRPFGLPIASERLYDPTSLRSRAVIDGLHHLDAFSFGGQEMLMPRWVLFDCGEFPGIVFGFGRTASALSPELRRAYHVEGAAHDDTFVPLSMWVAIRCAEQGAWFGHNLSSANYVPQPDPLPGLGTITKAYGVAVARVAKQYGATQWASHSVALHMTLGEMNLLGAYTPAHTHVETFTYRIDVDHERVTAPLRPGWSRPTEGGDRVIDAGDSDAIVALQDELERGARLRLHRVEVRGEDQPQRLWLVVAG